MAICKNPLPPRALERPGRQAAGTGAFPTRQPKALRHLRPSVPPGLQSRKILPSL